MHSITLAKERKEGKGNSKVTFLHYHELMSRVCWLVTYHTNKTMGKECCSRLSRCLWGGTNCELPYKRLRGRLGKKGCFGIFILTPLWMRCTGEIFSSENEMPTYVEPLGIRG